MIFTNRKCKITRYRRKQYSSKFNYRWFYQRYLSARTDKFSRKMNVTSPSTEAISNKK